MVSDFDKSLVEKYIPVNKQKKALKKLEKNYPIQYLIGDVDFYGCKILVNKNVLIPRFETESLVDKIPRYIKKYNFANPKIIDMGTGSGCISIFLKKNIKCDILAIDKSLKALKVAKKNAKLNNTDITFKHISIEKFKSTEKFDILVSNPPYIDINDEVDIKTKYEPQMALFAPKKGSDLRRDIKKKIDDIIKDVDQMKVEDIKKEFKDKVEEVTNGIEDLNKEKVLKAAKKKGKELQDKAEDLVKLAKEKGTPVLEGMANDLREKVISAAQEVIDKLEEK